VKRPLAGAIVALAMLASVSSLRNGFAYDDVPIIQEHAPLHDLGHIAHRFVEPYWPLAQGNALYRPVTTALFTLEWVIGHGSPLPFHIVNVLLYAAVCLTVYALARRLLVPAMAFAAAALYAVDPVHVEVFANSVGLSELITALTVVGAIIWYIDRRRAGQLRGGDIAVVAALYAVGCLTKEYAVVLPALLAMAELTVVDTERTWPQLRLLALSLALVAVSYLALRIRVTGSLVGEHPAIPLRNATYATRVLTMLSVVPEWIRLLVWPAHLAAVYSPPGTPVMDHVDPTVVVGAGVLLAIAALAVAGRRRVPVAAFGIAWAGLVMLPISNVMVKSGVLLAERTLFLPSVGAALVFGAIVPVLAARFPGPSVRPAAATVFAMVLGAGIWRSATRSPVWHDNDRLFAQSIVDEPYSYAAHFGEAGLMFNDKKYGTGEREARTAIRLYQDDERLFVDLGTEYERIGRCDAAVRLAHHALELSPHFVAARLIVARCLNRAGNYVALHSVAVAGMADGYQWRLFRQILFTADSGVRATSAGRH
jgi:protein O-mannosyl-transferase